MSDEGRDSVYFPHLHNLKRILVFYFNQIQCLICAHDQDVVEEEKLFDISLPKTVNLFVEDGLLGDVSQP
jgi:hypothetical protein